MHLFNYADENDIIMYESSATANRQMAQRFDCATFSVTLPGNGTGFMASLYFFFIDMDMIFD